MKIIAIADPDTALAFRLAGIETLPVARKEEAAAVLKQAAERPDMGIVLITQGLARAAGKQFEEVSHERHLPLLIEIPDTRGPIEKRLSAAEKMAAILRR